ncbi:MAG: hypothetical protein II838_10010 [Lachnospiraceae bacterium]|nr:hypothetical protein [Lachnospiraceae bacterium]
MNVKVFLKCFIVGIVLCMCTFGFLYWEGIIVVKNSLDKKYSVKGIDVSHYQGEIPWEKVKDDMNIKFAFIKATEGSNYVDENFAENWENSKKSGLYVGAYHFFSFDSPGKKQAKNYIEIVKKREKMLPPVVDVEYYADKFSNSPKVSELRTELDDFLYEIEEAYGCKPIIYTTTSVYAKYINEYFNGYPLWIRNVYYRPLMLKNRQWTFWQYSESEPWPYKKKGTEICVDMNVFAGNYKSFLRYFNLEE